MQAADDATADLPITAYRDEIVAAIKEYPFLIVVGETGSGKTTQLPQYILNDLPQFKRVAISQPRRVAAITVAERVAHEIGVTIPNSKVGYKIRFDDKTLSDTALNFMTDGLLLRECLSDASLSAYDVIILDEAHERSLESDVLMGLLKRTHGIRPGLRVIIMSATLNYERFSEFFDDCPVFQIPGRLFSVDVLYIDEGPGLGKLKSSIVKNAINAVLQIHCREPAGDILVFLTGRQEIEEACRILKDVADRQLEYSRDVTDKSLTGMVVYPIYGALQSLEQRAVFATQPPGKRKVVFATNIAATSITINGIVYVVDSGLVKQNVYDSSLAMDALVVLPISKSAADQRCGRAGRTAHGKAYRLYTADDYQEMREDTEPEICRTSLTSVV